jgi:hypothetical protein
LIRVVRFVCLITMYSRFGCNWLRFFVPWVSIWSRYFYLIYFFFCLKTKKKTQLTNIVIEIKSTQHFRFQLNYIFFLPLKNIPRLQVQHHSNSVILVSPIHVLNFVAIIHSCGDYKLWSLKISYLSHYQTTITFKYI